jgi:hypothetical protein
VLPSEIGVRWRPRQDSVHDPVPDPDNAAVHDGDVQGVTVGVQDRRRLHPPVHVALGQPLGQVGVHPGGPGVTGSVRDAHPSRLGDPFGAWHARPGGRHRARTAGPGPDRPAVPAVRRAALSPEQIRTERVTVWIEPERQTISGESGSSLPALAMWLGRAPDHPTIQRTHPEVVVGILPTPSLGTDPCGMLRPRHHPDR